MENSGVKWGVIGAVATVLISLLTYIVGQKFYLQAGSWIGMFAGLFFLYKSGIEARQQAGGYISFQEVLKSVFTTYIIMTVASTIMQYVMYKFVDPGLIDVTKQIAMEGMEKMKGILGEEGYEEAMEQMETQDFAPSIRQSLRGLAFSIILGFGVSAIFAAIIKRKQPEY